MDDWSGLREDGNQLDRTAYPLGLWMYFKGKGLRDGKWVSM
jgi:hypothetical protein